MKIKFKRITKNEFYPISKKISTGLDPACTNFLCYTESNYLGIFNFIDIPFQQSIELQIKLRYDMGSHLVIQLLVNDFTIFLKFILRSLVLQNPHRYIEPVQVQTLQERIQKFPRISS